MTSWQAVADYALGYAIGAALMFATLLARGIL